MQNLDYLNEKSTEIFNRELYLDLGQFDATNLPFRTNTIDYIVTDLPFGKRITEGMLGVNNRYDIFKIQIQK